MILAGKTGKSSKKKSKSKKNRIPTANVLIYLNSHNPDYELVQKALKAWNKTKAFCFRQVKNLKKTNILITSGNYGETTWAGMTQMANVPRGYLYGSIIYLNDYYLNQLSSHIQLAVAEHELGHAHNDTEPSVMNPAVSDENAYTIQKCDIEAVKRIYHKR
ncbi:matrixin family metalloprotease [Lactobacillus helveticus]|uniref:Matrixin n=1 Tax=Lactobacillus helveticus TaxID=1587 RepID=A0A3Q8STB4_LACHE|nr:matrixin family metalloprotease [Lactobacillus helveticus]AFR21745.1 hypothetical protein R0052_04225 [Lactobacillus helveticus R0052]AZK90346.1 Matrixin [Lactobacillus helveticus]MCJ2190168.1 matrixin family metalloprotease [Lactobacillus helveticus]UOE24156.1 matrixin family metalloprotease [Lactobacillus helveticus]UWE06879.1 matrixin family metalloprotease [Lactobacillus helveticus]